MFGQALALQGPAGSMLKAITILHDYKDHAIKLFTIAVVSLGLSSICGFYYIFSWYGAHVSTFFAFLFMFYWHKYCLQIYNEMKYIPDLEARESIANPLIEIEKRFEKDGNVPENITRNIRANRRLSATGSEDGGSMTGKSKYKNHK